MSATGCRDALQQLDEAVATGKITPAAEKNIRGWLTEPRYADYVDSIAEQLADEQFEHLNRTFWKILEFGTGGRRGEMAEVGSAVMNVRTMGESAAGLAEYVKNHAAPESSLACAIAYDTRHQSREFARLCAEILVAAGFTVYFLDDPRSTPELSFAVRFKNCACGIMITASHNPPSDNGFKAYWNNGAQLVPPHDQGVIERVMQAGEIARVDFDDAVAAGQVVRCQDEVDQAFLDAVLQQSYPGSRALKVLYSPLHGVGAASILPALATDGFNDVELFAPHAAPDGDFPNVPDHVANPENSAVFDAMIERCQQAGFDIALATDPDCDRLGCAAPRTIDTDGAWGTFTGNQLCGLLCDYILSKRQAAGTLTPDHFVVTTLVTTQLVRRIADGYGIKTYDNLLVGFKWIAQQIDAAGAEHFLYGSEESHGIMAGTHTRDKDGVVAVMLTAEMAAEAKANGQSLHQKLDNLFLRFGCHAEKTISIYMQGETGMDRMKAVMARLRKSPPSVLADLKVACVRDYLRQTVTDADGNQQPLDGPVGDLVMLDFQAEGNYVAIRPSGTEPKVKFYLFGYHPPEDDADLVAVKQMLADRLTALERDLRQVVEA